jgi:hypothetical protein
MCCPPLQLEYGFPRYSFEMTHNTRSAGLVTLLHPGHDIAAALNFPIMNVRRVARASSSCPIQNARPSAIAGGVNDEDIDHAH